MLAGKQNDTAILEDSLQFLTKPNILFPYDPAVGQLGIYSKELKACIQTKNCTQMFRAAYSSSPKFGSIKRSFRSGWINWYIQTMGCYSELKGKRDIRPYMKGLETSAYS